MQTYRSIVNALYVLLASSACAVIGCLPLMAAWVLVPGIDWYLPFCLAGAASAPGVAALFAIFRDHPALRPEVFAPLISRGHGHGRGAAKLEPSSQSAQGGSSHMTMPDVPDAADSRPDWIAAPYVPDDVDVAMFRPYCRAYRRLFVRSLRLSIPAFALVTVLCYDVQLLLQVSWGALLIPVALVLAVMTVMALLVAVCLTVEYPKATWTALMRNGVLLSVRRLPMTVIDLLALAVYGYGLAHSPFLVLTLATGLTAYLIWAGVRWQIQPLAVALTRQSHNPGGAPAQAAKHPRGRIAQ